MLDFIANEWGPQGLGFDYSVLRHFMNRLRMMPLNSPFTHPVTGVIHTATEDGWSPPMDSTPSPVITRWLTGNVPVPTDQKEREIFLATMPGIAKGLSEITGCKIEWHYSKDAINWGDYGFFKVKLD